MREKITDLIIWVALTMSIAPAVLAVWIFSKLCAGTTIVGDSHNLLELYISIAILVLVGIAWCCFTIRKLKG